MEYSFHTAVAGNAEMDYFRFGHGDRAFVILPGLSLVSVMQSASAVAGAYARFGEKFTVYVFDRRKNLPERYSAHAMAEDTATVMKSIGIEASCLFGVSQGGMMAAYIAAEYPELVAKAVIGSCAAHPSETAKAVIDRWRSLAAVGNVKALNHDFFETVYTPRLLKQFADSLPMLESNGTKEDCDRFMILSQSVPYCDIGCELKRIKCPLLAVGAGDDKVFPGNYAREIADLSGGESFVYEGYGHAVYDEAPDYKDRIDKFFG